MKSQFLDANTMAVWDDQFPTTPNLRLLNAWGGPCASLQSVQAVMALKDVCEKIASATDSRQEQRDALLRGE